jgi:nucleotide-binding universal stress UspA family protein
MSATTALLIVVLGWLAIGVVLAVVMGRRGHSAFSWGALGVVLGPLALPLALRDANEERHGRTDVLAAGGGGSGIQVLIGVDGSPESSAAVDAATELLGGRIGRCVLASVVDLDTAESTAPSPARARTRACLEREATRVRERLGCEPALVLLAGVPAAALREYAAEHGVDVLVVGSRGQGASKYVFGSVASSLSRTAPAPVMVVSAGCARYVRAAG